MNGLFTGCNPILSRHSAWLCPVSGPMSQRGVSRPHTHPGNIIAILSTQDCECIILSSSASDASHWFTRVPISQGRVLMSAVVVAAVVVAAVAVVCPGMCDAVLTSDYVGVGSSSYSAPVS